MFLTAEHVPFCVNNHIFAFERSVASVSVLSIQWDVFYKTVSNVCAYWLSLQRLIEEKKCWKGRSEQRKIYVGGGKGRMRIVKI